MPGQPTLDSLPSLNTLWPQTWWPYLLLLAAAFVIGFFLIGRPRAEKPWRVKARPLLTDNELEFAQRLQEALPEYRILAQVAMGALLDPDLDPEESSEPGRFLSVRGRFAQKIIDFVIVDDFYEVVALVELDDQTHDPDKDAERDEMTAMAGYLTIRYDSRQKPPPEEIRDDFIHAGLID